MKLSQLSTENSKWRSSALRSRETGSTSAEMPTDMIWLLLIEYSIVPRTSRISEALKTSGNLARPLGGIT